MSRNPLSPLRALLRMVLTWALAFAACVAWTVTGLHP